MNTTSPELLLPPVPLVSHAVQQALVFCTAEAAILLILRAPAFMEQSNHRGGLADLCSEAAASLSSFSSPIMVLDVLFRMTLVRACSQHSHA